MPFHFCPQCGTKLQPGFRFCPSCGEKIPCIVDESGPVSPVTSLSLSPAKKDEAVVTASGQPTGSTGKHLDSVLCRVKHRFFRLCVVFIFGNVNPVFLRHMDVTPQLKLRLVLHCGSHETPFVWRMKLHLILAMPRHLWCPPLLSKVIYNGLEEVTD